MNKEIIKDWLSDIATPTGISYSGDQTISESMAENIVNYVDELEQRCKKQKEVINKIIEMINYYGVDKEYNDNVILRHILKDMLDILKEVSE